MTLDIKTVLTVFCSGAVTALVTLILREWFARGREERDRASWQLSNLYNFYFEQYLSPEIKGCRRRIYETERSSDGVIRNLTDDLRQLSRALQRVGIMVYMGSIPLGYALILNGTQIVGDWLLVKRHLRGTHDDLETLPALWRHAEWLALISWMWFATQKVNLSDFDQNAMDKLLSEYGNVRRIRRREKMLFRVDHPFVGKSTESTARKIRRLLLWRSLLRKRD